MNSIYDVFFCIPPGESSKVFGRRSNILLLGVVKGKGKIIDVDYNKEFEISPLDEENSFKQNKKELIRLGLKGNNFIITASKENVGDLVVFISHVRLFLI